MGNSLYAKSENIEVFPSSLRGLKVDLSTDDPAAFLGSPKGKFTSEANLAGIVTTISGRNDYIKEVKDNNVYKYIIVIHGYRFLLNEDIPHVMQTTEGEVYFDNVYACISVEKGSGRLVDEIGQTTMDYKVGDKNEFRGLWFSPTKPSSIGVNDYDIHPLHVYERYEESAGVYKYRIPEESLLHVDPNSIYGLVPVKHGGTGVSTLDDLTAGEADNAKISHDTTYDTEVFTSLQDYNKYDRIWVGERNDPYYVDNPKEKKPEKWAGKYYPNANAKHATTAYKLDYKITINGTDVPFTGDLPKEPPITALEITTKKWGTERTITVKSFGGTPSGKSTGDYETTVTVDGGANFDIKLPKTIVTHIEGKADYAGTADRALNAKIAHKTEDSGSGSTIYDRIWVGDENEPGKTGAQYYEIGNAKHSISAYSTYKLDDNITVNGTTFCKSGDNITTDKWGTARTITLKSGNNTKDNTGINGSKDITLNLPDTLKASLDGNAATATKLTTDTAGTLKYPVYFSDGVPKLCDGTLSNNISGKADTAGTADTAKTLTSSTLGSRGLISQSIYLSSGTATAGQKITASSSQPSGPSVGDIWLVIKE